MTTASSSHEDTPDLHSLVCKLSAQVEEMQRQMSGKGKGKGNSGPDEKGTDKGQGVPSASVGHGQSNPGGANPQPQQWGMGAEGGYRPPPWQPQGSRPQAPYNPGGIYNQGGVNVNSQQSQQWGVGAGNRPPWNLSRGRGRFQDEPCFKCKAPGHMKRDCPRLFEPTCYKCGGLGHRQFQCQGTSLNY